MYQWTLSRFMYAKQKLLSTMPNIQFNIDLVWPLPYEQAGTHVRCPQIVCWYSPTNFKPNLLFFICIIYIYLFPFLSCHRLISHFCQKINLSIYVNHLWGWPVWGIQTAELACQGPTASRILFYLLKALRHNKQYDLFQFSIFVNFFLFQVWWHVSSQISGKWIKITSV